jgi:hypothetical protein
MAHYLFNVQRQNRLEQKGLLKRFSIECYGHQPTIEEMRAEKSEKYKELKDKRGTLEYDEYFLRYRPADSTKEQKEKNMSRLSNVKTSNKMNDTRISNKISNKTSDTRISKKKQVKVKKTKRRRYRKKQGFFF